MKILKRILAVTLVICTGICLTACQEKDFSIDKELLGPIEGEYQVIEQDADGDDYVGSWWHLGISAERDGEPYLSIYDNEAGNPGIQGPIVSLNGSEIVVEYDPDYYEELPSDKWTEDGKYLTVKYAVTDDGIELTNNGKTLEFKRDWFE